MKTYFNFFYSTALDYLNHYEKATGFSSLLMKVEHLELFNFKQFVLTNEILNRVFALIRSSPENLINTEKKEELEKILIFLFNESLLYFVIGKEKNPIHHNIQTVENILQIVIDEKESYDFIRKAVILALLHDIGNGFVKPNLKKIKSSDISDRKNELNNQKLSKDEIDEELKQLIDHAKEYRMAHMIEGSIIAEKLINQLNNAKELNITIEKNEINEIKKIILIHDIPSIAEYYSSIDKVISTKDLIPLDNRLAVILREADRLWMVSKEGLEKDLFDDLKKNKNPNPLEKLKHNYNRFKDEYKLYVNSNCSKEELYGFKNETLFRTDAGFNLLTQYMSNRINEILSYDYDINIMNQLKNKN